MRNNLYTLLLAFFPVLFLYSNNMNEVSVVDVTVPIVIVGLMTVIVLLVSRLISKSWGKSGVITSLFLLLFYTFGYVRDWLSSIGLNDIYIIGVGFQNQLVILCAWAVIFIIGTVLIIRYQVNWIASTLGIISVVLVLLSLISIVYSLVVNTQVNKSDSATQRIYSKDNPDIYYIILDEYARQDTLKDVFDYDNIELINYLASKGFYVSDNSSSNYANTWQSMTSSLNSDYLTQKELTNDDALFEMWSHNSAADFLKSIGYRYIYIGGNFDIRQLSKYTDDYYVYQYKWLSQTGFTYEIARTTAAWPFLRFAQLYSGEYDRQSVLYAFDKLMEISDDEISTFTYAHIMCPHSPFVFDANGALPVYNSFMGKKWIATDDYPSTEYLNQLKFVNHMIIDALDKITENENTIIILQSDHGLRSAGKSDSFKILNAYRMSNHDGLYNSISPVNSFRVIFNNYFGAKFNILPDMMVEAGKE